MRPLPHFLSVARLPHRGELRWRMGFSAAALLALAVTAALKRKRRPAEAPEGA